ncbi:uncharacterized protein LOC122086854, partial [Macadamia integrifolia]|uniref:uncharacterized protein LOC122086854 n=1 Tax=Macadamia integrifolia TaxID=60698 RepID=UPI001C4F86B3
KSINWRPIRQPRLLSNNSTDTTTTTYVPNSTTVTAATSQHSDTPKQNLRGLNKCSECGNVVRSRCPYQSCKGCCVKAQNPRHIHDKTPSSSATMFNQQSTEASPTSALPMEQKSTCFILRLQLWTRFQGFTKSLFASSTFQHLSKFNGAQVPLCSRRPLTRRVHIFSLDAAAINQWRFSTQKEYKERNIEAENEAFDRYMNNVGLVEEVFFLSFSLEEPAADMLFSLEPILSFGEDNHQRMI